MRGIVYINGYLNKKKFTYTGIEFYEFMRGLKKPIENILLLQGNYVGNEYINHFELIRGKSEVEKLIKEDVYNYGNFCFVDYKPGTVEQMTKQEIAELLYLSHMYIPMNSPFFDVIENRFAYLAHDDGYFAKLYCRNINDFSDVLGDKIYQYVLSKDKRRITELDVNIKQGLLELTEEALLIDLETIEYSKNKLKIEIFLLRENRIEYDMDMVFNFYEKNKRNAACRGYLIFEDGAWEIAL